MCSTCWKQSSIDQSSQLRLNFGFYWITRFLYSICEGINIMAGVLIPQVTLTYVLLVDAIYFPTFKNLLASLVLFQFWYRLSLLLKRQVISQKLRLPISVAILVFYSTFVVRPLVDVSLPTLNNLAIYWIPKVNKNPYKHRFIAGSSKCSTKPLSILLTKLLSSIKQGLQKYCETASSRSGINQMWILKNSKEL